MGLSTCPQGQCLICTSRTFSSLPHLAKRNYSDSTLLPPTRSRIDFSELFKGGSMWTKQQNATEAPAAPPVQTPASPVIPFNASSTPRLGRSRRRQAARLGARREIKGPLLGQENLQTERKV